MKKSAHTKDKAKAHGVRILRVTDLPVVKSRDFFDTLPLRGILTLFLKLFAASSSKTKSESANSRFYQNNTHTDAQKSDK